jgi:hypothetical protein
LPAVPAPFKLPVSHARLESKAFRQVSNKRLDRLPFLIFFATSA